MLRRGCPCLGHTLHYASSHLLSVLLSVWRARGFRAGGQPRILGRGCVLTLTRPSPRRYAVMLRCWAADPTVRPTFTVLVEEVEHVAARLLGDHYVQLPAAYVNLGASTSDEARKPPEQSQTTPVHRSTARPRPLSEPPQPT